MNVNEFDIKGGWEHQYQGGGGAARVDLQVRRQTGEGSHTSVHLLTPREGKLPFMKETVNKKKYI